MNWIVFIFIICSLQGFIFAFIVLCTKYYKNYSNRYLAYTFFIIGVLGLLNAFEILIGDSYIFIHVLLDNMPFELLFTATFLTFISLKSESKFLKGKHIFLYFPFYLFSISNIYIVTFDALGFIPDHELSFIYILFNIQYFFVMIYAFSAGVYGLMLLHRSTHLDNENRKWLQYIVAIFLSLNSIWIISEIYDIIMGRESVFMEYLLWIGVTSYFYWVSYKGLIRFKLLEERYEITQIIQSSLSKEKKKTRADNSNVHFQKLEAFMIEKQVYLDENLNRENIADQIGISPGYLSKIINNVTNENFSQYVNSYRVEAVKIMIQDPVFNKYSLLAIGYESGFNSKTGFYNAFKKQTGMTPNEYKIVINKS